MKKYYLFLISLFLFSADCVLAQGVPVGRAIRIGDIISLANSVGGFLLLLGSILATITIIGTGIMYLTAGSNTQRLTTAKGMLKAGIIGALVVFSAGVIISTVRDFAEDPLQFFGTGNNNNGAGYCDSNNVCWGGSNDGSLCNVDADCN